MALAEIKLSAKRAWQNAFIRWNLIGDLLVVIFAGSFFLWRLIPEGLRSDVLVMHYNIFLGIDNVQTWWWIILVPVAMLGVLILNYLLAFYLFRFDALAAKTLAGLTSVLIAVWCVSSFFLMLVNI